MFDPLSAGRLGGFNLLGSMSQSKAAGQAAQPLPTYYQYTQSPEQQQMWQTMWPMFQNMMGGGDWYSGLDENVRAGIEQPYQRSLEMARNAMGGWGGNQSAGWSGGAADVFGDLAQQAAPTMAQSGFNMMMNPMMAMMPQTMPDMLVGHHPTMQQVQPGAAIPTGYQQPSSGFGTQPEGTYNPYMKRNMPDWGF